MQPPWMMRCRPRCIMKPSSSRRRPRLLQQSLSQPSQPQVHRMTLHHSCWTAWNGWRPTWTVQHLPNRLLHRSPRVASPVGTAASWDTPNASAVPYAPGKPPTAAPVSPDFAAAPNAWTPVSGYVSSNDMPAMPVLILCLAMAFSARFLWLADSCFPPSVSLHCALPRFFLQVYIRAPMHTFPLFAPQLLLLLFALSLLFMSPYSCKPCLLTHSWTLGRPQRLLVASCGMNSPQLLH